MVYNGDNVPMPTHFYKVLFDPRREEAISFIIPHTRVLASELSRYIVSIDQVEELTGLDFLDRLENTKEAKIERRHPNRHVVILYLVTGCHNAYLPA